MLTASSPTNPKPQVHRQLPVWLHLPMIKLRPETILNPTTYSGIAEFMQ